MLVAPYATHIGESALGQVHYLVAIATIDENTQVEALVTEGVGPAESILRHW